MLLDLILISFLATPLQACVEKEKPLKVSGSSFEPFTTIAYTTNGRITLKLETTAENGDINIYKIYKNSAKETCVLNIFRSQKLDTGDKETEKCGGEVKKLNVKLDPKNKLTGRLVFTSENEFAVYSSKDGKMLRTLPSLQFEIDEENPKRWEVTAFEHKKAIGGGVISASQISRASKTKKKQKRIVDLQNLDGDLRGFQLHIAGSGCSTRATYSEYSE